VRAHRRPEFNSTQRGLALNARNGRSPARFSQKIERGDKQDPAARQKYCNAARAARRVCLVELLLPCPDENRNIRPAGTRYALPGAEKSKKLNAVRQREPHVWHVCRIHDRGLAQLAHPPRLFRAQQVTHAGMPADKFACTGLLETLGSPAVRLQFHFLILLHNFLAEFRLE
jgi:hypothetical protein